MSAVDPMEFLRSGKKRRRKCRYAEVRDELQDEVRGALLAAEDDADVSAKRMLELIAMYKPKSVGLTTVKAHRAGCPTCEKESL